MPLASNVADLASCARVEDRETAIPVTDKHTNRFNRDQDIVGIATQAKLGSLVAASASVW